MTEGRAVPARTTVRIPTASGDENAEIEFLHRHAKTISP
jgi:hypothetical protein